ncbi:MAG: helix-turn-helix transcriptional regulator [Firmicutes bacterium]|nr:helix-turn-helix transcriptional regulator [Bacillota bacterium]
MEDIRIGKKIKELRKKHNITQVELAKAIHVSDKTISKWENDNNGTDYQTIKRICKYFNISTSELLEGETKKKNFFKRLHNSFNYLKSNGSNLIFIVLFMLLLFYFLNNFNTIQMYEIRTDDKYLIIDNSYFVVSKEKTILVISGIDYDFEDDNLISTKYKLFTYVNNDKYYFYESDELNSIFIESRFDSIISKDIAKNIPNNLYLEIESINEDNEVTKKKIKLIIKLILNNNKVIPYKSLENIDSSPKTKELNINEFVLLNKDFIRMGDTNFYYKDLKNFRVTIDEEFNKMIYTEVDGKYKNHITYNYEKDVLHFKRTKVISDKEEKVEYIFYYNKIDNSLNCVKEDCKNYLKDYENVMTVFDSIFK